MLIFARLPERNTCVVMHMLVEMNTMTTCRLCRGIRFPVVVVFEFFFSVLGSFAYIVARPRFL